MINPLSPKREHELAKALNAYTDPSSDEYDAELTARLRALRPDWFEDEPDRDEHGGTESDEDERR